MGLKRASAIGSRGSRSRFVNQFLTKLGNATLHNSHTKRASRIGVSTCRLDDRSRPPPRAPNRTFPCKSKTSESGCQLPPQQNGNRHPANGASVLQFPHKRPSRIGVSVSRPSKMETDTPSTEHPYCNSHTKGPPESGCQFLPPAKWKPTPRQQSIRTAIPTQKTLPNRGVSFFRQQTTPL